jgi:N-acetylglutamate synthase-like GNAT family acetyltransferase
MIQKMNGLIIKEAEMEDCEAISQLISENTRVVSENKYSEEQMQVWIIHTRPEAIQKLLERRTIFCAFLKNELVGTIALEDGEMVGLYISVSYLRKGIGKELLIHLENYVRALNIDSLSLTSTPAGLPFYLANGYVIQGPETIVVDGVEFHETQMMKQF